MIQARWLIIFFAVLGMSIPSFALDWSLGGFPSYLRTRARVSLTMPTARDER